ncbi:peptidoglycan editing factor PgeF [Bacillus cihuensis]|uniref:peptidoglycan editing factor PgeF n=1 Tax=Bacillus cihuensis TaxID=1208599 RepID=UPI00040C004E|nr:peptidoglycan editing factor PgeF [Bacillus cihuensis]
MTEPFLLREEEFYCLESWMNKFPGLIAGFTTKNGGVSKGDYASLNIGFHVGDNTEDVIANRQILAKKLSFPLTDWVCAEQTHETKVEKVFPSDCGKGSKDYLTSLKATDGLFTTEKQILLTLCYADCVPLYYIAPKYGKVGIAHAGWRGTVSGIAASMIESWNQAGIKSTDIHVAIGPAICGECYVVDNKIVKFVQKLVEDYDEKPYNLISDGQYKLNLKQVNTEILVKAGVPREQIEISTLCTSCENDTFFSHRRDQGKTGRLMSFIGWKEE